RDRSPKERVMHPYLFPWVLPSGVLEALAYLAAIAVAALVASWVAGPRKKPGFWPRFFVPFLVLAGVGATIVKRNAPFEPQPLPLHTYGLMIALGFLTAAHLAGRQSPRLAAVAGTAFFLPDSPVLARTRKEGADAVGRAARQIGRASCGERWRCAAPRARSMMRERASWR